MDTALPGKTGMQAYQQNKQKSHLILARTTPIPIFLTWVCSMTMRLSRRTWKDSHFFLQAASTTMH